MGRAEPIGAREFLRRLQRLLDEGEFTATYKFALLNALADLAVEKASPADGRLVVTKYELAEKFVRYYWRQAQPFPGSAGQAVLLQNSGTQAAVIKRLVELRAGGFTSLEQVAANAGAWNGLLSQVAGTIVEMPLAKLQRIRHGSDGHIVDEFLYRHADIDRRNGQVTLRPGVDRWLREFHGLIVALVRGAWLGKVRQLRKNQPIIGPDSQLDLFLFGTERNSLAIYADLFREYQRGRCFYCQRAVRSHAEIDHFIPWSRYPLDLPNNFVYTHHDCNHRKRDHLAHWDYLARWRERNLEDRELQERLREKALLPAAEQCRHVASWAYAQVQAAGGHVWRAPRELLPLGDQWRAALRIERPLLQAAERPPNYRGD